MKYVYFFHSGKYSGTENEDLCLTTYNRLSSYYEDTPSRNAFILRIKIPMDFYKNHFKFELTNKCYGFYRTKLLWKDIKQFITEYNYNLMPEKVIIKTFLPEKVSELVFIKSEKE